MAVALEQTGFLMKLELLLWTILLIFLYKRTITLKIKVQNNAFLLILALQKVEAF